MPFDPVIQIVLVLSAVASLSFLFSLWRSALTRGWKIVFTLLLIPPVIGPLMYLWIRNFPPPSIESLNGRGAGFGGKFLDAELSKKHGGKTLFDGFNDDEAEENRKREDQKRKARKRNRESM